MHHWVRGLMLIVLSATLTCAMSLAQAQDDMDSEPSYEPATAYNPSPAPTSTTVSEKNYTGLLEALPLYESGISNPWPIVPETQRILKPGSKNPAVLNLEERLKRTRDLPETYPGKRYYDRNVAEAVKVFQWRHGLHVDGVVGKDTLNALNVPAEVRVKQLRLNIKRWEDLSTKLGHRYLMVNIPEFRLHLIDNDQEALTMKVVVGKPELQTPQLTSSITRIVFNPPWNIPRKIAQNDIVPKVIENPSYLNENSIRIFNSEESDAYEISRYDVDWRDAKSNGFQYHLRQDPGEKNALGMVKFEFQNTDSVYLHDTPAKNFFSQDYRALSHGCVRLEKPFALVSYFIQNDPRIDETGVQERLDRGTTSYFRVQAPLPIIITYLTAWIDDHGLVNFRDDLYQIDNPAPIPDQVQGGTMTNIDN